MIMPMNLYPLKFREYSILTILFIIGYLLTVSQKYFIPLYIRPFTFFIIAIVVFYLFFLIIRPKEQIELSNTLALMLSMVTLVIIYIQHIVITFDLSWKAVIILLGTILGPYISGYLYKKTKR